MPISGFNAARTNAAHAITWAILIEQSPGVTTNRLLYSNRSLTNLPTGATSVVQDVVAMSSITTQWGDFGIQAGSGFSFEVQLNDSVGVTRLMLAYTALVNQTSTPICYVLADFDTTDYTSLVQIYAGAIDSIEQNESTTTVNVKPLNFINETKIPKTKAENFAEAYYTPDKDYMPTYVPGENIPIVLGGHNFMPGLPINVKEGVIQYLLDTENLYTYPATYTTPYLYTFVEHSSAWLRFINTEADGATENAGTVNATGGTSYYNSCYFTITNTWKLDTTSITDETPNPMKINFTALGSITSYASTAYTIVGNAKNCLSGTTSYTDAVGTNEWIFVKIPEISFAKKYKKVVVKVEMDPANYDLTMANWKAFAMKNHNNDVPAAAYYYTNGDTTVTGSCDELISGHSTTSVPGAYFTFDISTQKLDIDGNAATYEKYIVDEFFHSADGEIGLTYLGSSSPKIKHIYISEMVVCSDEGLATEYPTYVSYKYLYTARPNTFLLDEAIEEIMSTEVTTYDGGAATGSTDNLFSSATPDDDQAQIYGSSILSYSYFHSNSGSFQLTSAGYTKIANPVPGLTTYVDAIWIRFKHTSMSGAAEFQCQICEDSSGDPGAQVSGATKTISYSAYDNGIYKWHRFRFPSTITLTSGTQYWIVFSANSLPVAGTVDVALSDDDVLWSNALDSKKYNGAWAAYSSTVFFAMLLQGESGNAYIRAGVGYKHRIQETTTNQLISALCEQFACRFYRSEDSISFKMRVLAPTTPVYSVAIAANKVEWRNGSPSITMSMTNPENVYTTINYTYNYRPQSGKSEDVITIKNGITENATGGATKNIDGWAVFFSYYARMNAFLLSLHHDRRFKLLSVNMANLEFIDIKCGEYVEVTYNLSGVSASAGYYMVVGKSVDLVSAKIKLNLQEAIWCY